MCREHCDDEAQTRECEANARLIAAAPDMLAALGRAINDIDNPETIRPKSQHTLSMATQQLMRETIAKAKGEK